MYKNYKIIFIITLILSTFIAISSMSWFSSWIGLEINLLSFLTLMNSNKNKYLSESSIKYFIIQTMASSLYLFSILLMINMKSLEMSKNIEYYFSLLINSALMLKLGAAPFHFWLPEVISSMNWMMSLILLTWQKIAPLILLSYSICLPNFFMLFIIFSSLISGLQGMNQICLRKILAYSSINHISWMLSCILNSINTWLIYLSIYFIINMNIVIIFMKYNILYLNQISNIFSFNKKIKFFFMLNWLSLAGLPPFLGFFPKWLVFNNMIENNFYLMMFMMTMFSLISMYLYMRISFTSILMISKESINKTFKYTNYLYMYTNMISLSSLMFFFIFPLY